METLPVKILESCRFYYSTKTTVKPRPSSGKGLIFLAVRPLWPAGFGLRLPRGKNLGAQVAYLALQKPSGGRGLVCRHGQKKGATAGWAVALNSTYRRRMEETTPKRTHCMQRPDVGLIIEPARRFGKYFLCSAV
ncbi:hypothetical protein [Rivihabitans pingtungensis]|uniref:hypothetical protein n=1 Tax=Rivihabitans pingtungensis TaxID=1054498 RepID=UPI0023F214A1|nr:hypothetical protein [Rivihabitans pingtungensis]